MPQNQILHDAIKDFKRATEITRDVRFQGNIRLGLRQRMSGYVVSLISLYVIAISLIPNIVELLPFQSQMLLSFSIILSVFVIFTSILDGAQNFYHQGELLHQCGRKVAIICHKLKNIDVESDPQKAAQDLCVIQIEYNKALDYCPVNHAPADYIWAMLQKPHLFPHTYTARWHLPMKIYLRSRLILATWAWLVPHFIAVASITWIIYEYIIQGSILVGSGNIRGC